MKVFNRNMCFYLFLLFLISVNATTVFYDSYFETQLTEEEVKRHEKANTTLWCVNEIKPCDPEEGRRLDGSCNNLKHPIRGATHTPFYRVLPPVYSEGFEPRKSKSGKELPLSRFLRTSLLPEGRVPDQTFTSIITHYMVFMASDVTGPHDTVNYILWKPHCCMAKGAADNMCVRLEVPDDDPVHRFSDIRCLNMTKPISFQSSGCIKNDTSPERLDTATPLLDLSTIYGKDEKVLREKFRQLKDGLLKIDVENGRVWPPKVRATSTVCYGNKSPQETRCHATPDDSTNSIIGINLFSIWFWRQHNYIAKELKEVNSCWDDEKLFETARDINIAIALQIYYYELLPALMGKENLIKSGVISTNPGFRNIYNENIIPQISLEYPFVLRWVHTIQEGQVKMYDNKGNYLKQIPVGNLTVRTGYLAIEDNIDHITQGTFRQGCGKLDYVVDPEISESALGHMQRASDVPTSDNAKNRLFGLPSYIKYREHCFKKPIHKFDDLEDAFEPENLEKLKEVYEHVEDIDLISGIWLENTIPGGHVPETFYCLVVDQMIRTVLSDRHWYERADRPKAFTFEQLKEIRKASIAQMLCTVGDKVTNIQPNAFLRPSPENRISDCTELDFIDYWAWENFTCEDIRSN